MWNQPRRQAKHSPVLQPDLQSQIQAAHEAKNHGVPTPTVRDLRQAEPVVDAGPELPESHLLSPVRTDEGKLAKKACGHAYWCSCQKLWEYYESERDEPNTDPVSN